jgi:hypothetical protein
MSKREFEQAQKIRSEVDDVVKLETPEEKTQAADLQRRRTLIAGLAAAPAVLSLMNRSAWGAAAEVSCSLVASYVNSGNRWQSPRPANENGTLEIKEGDITRCGL